MKKLYIPLIIAILSLGSCSQELPSVPQKPQDNTETPGGEPETPVVPDYSKLKILLPKLNLEDPGLFRVKAALNAQDSAQVEKELLRYFRERASLRADVKHPDVNIADKDSHKGEKLAEGVVKQANDALEHIFLANKNYAPIYYGDDIDWAKPNADNEVRWQLHRMYWWMPMGQVYWSTLDEKYAKEWIFELKDWITKNPCKPEHNNFKWAWRPLEVSTRISDQTALLNYFVTSENFTPEIIVDFLVNYWTHCDFLINNFPYDNGNHLLFCGNGIYTAGCFFPEFKDARSWREAGANLLNEQLNVQVYDDGVQNEFAPKYQGASISQFLQATDFARLNGRASDYPDAYYTKIRKMIDVLANISMVIPDSKNSPIFDMPMFGDTDHMGSGLAKYFTNWLNYFPDDQTILYFSSNGGKGTRPSYTSAAHEKGGFYTLRNGWNKTATMMAITAHPQQVWHSHPDIGTFELSVKGRLFMPDAGYYKYEGDAATTAERNLYRRSSVHKIMTLGNGNIKVSNVKQLRWDISQPTQVLSVENQSYDNLKVIRTIYFQSKATAPYYVIVDEGVGDAIGQIDVHFNMLENAGVVYDETKKQMYTGFTDNNNLLIQSFCPAADDFSLVKVQGDDARISYSYGTYEQGKAVAFRTTKNDATTKQVVTVLYPFEAIRPDITLTGISGSGATGNLKVNLTIDGTAVNFN